MIPVSATIFVAAPRASRAVGIVCMVHACTCAAFKYLCTYACMHALLQCQKFLCLYVHLSRTIKVVSRSARVCMETCMLRQKMKILCRSGIGMRARAHISCNKCVDQQRSFFHVHNTPPLDRTAHRDLSMTMCRWSALKGIT